jgi:hypothetical protein
LYITSLCIEINVESWLLFDSPGKSLVKLDRPYVGALKNSSGQGRACVDIVLETLDRDATPDAEIFHFGVCQKP